jgi:hypothetical protein
VIDLSLLTHHVPPFSSKTPEAAQQWFTRQGVELQLPAELVAEWDFQSLAAIYFTPHREAAIPTLEFRKGNSQARVLLVRRGQVDAGDLASRTQAPEYDNPPRVLGNREQGEYIALVVIDQGKYGDFLKSSKPQPVT